MARSYQPFSYRGACMRLASPHPSILQAEIRRQRDALDGYVKLHPDFLVAMTPLDTLPGAPAVARRMADAGWRVGVGPMAAVAGAVAEMGVLAGLRAGDAEAIVENGGDLYLASPEEVIVGLYAGSHALSGRIALRVRPDRMPLAVCSSSSTMGHSLSLGCCDLATVVGRDGALVDAAATLACNLVLCAEDVEAALDTISSIQGIDGVLIVSGERVGVAGNLPELVRHEDAGMRDKITRHAGSRLE